MQDLPEHGTAVPITVLKLAVDRVILIPACCQAACSASMSVFDDALPLAYWRLNWSFVPTGTWHFAALIHAVTPFGSTFQPFLVRRSVAFFTLYG